jgi:hypothetical protein
VLRKALRGCASYLDNMTIVCATNRDLDPDDRTPEEARLPC